MRVLIVHPDLGVGGAERLILDVANATKSNGHEVTILTNQYDPNHCFEDSKEFNIIVKGSWVPRHLAGRLHAFFAYFKMVLASLWLICLSGLKFDAVICDQISLPVALFKWTGYKVLFYCHFPDQLLCVYDKKKNFLKRFYRAPLDWLETVTTGMADIILVNSQFTSKIFRETFKSLHAKKLDVLYPSLNTDNFDKLLESLKDDGGELEEAKSDLQKENLTELAKADGKRFVFVSINRYERKKDLKLALNSLVYLRTKLSKADWDSCHLIMAGGYDWRVNENVFHYEELKELASSLNLNDHISFMRSISDKQKIYLLKKAFCLVYTPTNEHFGIVPIEAMYCGRPVIATNTGGPLETVADNSTGYLVPPEADKFSDAMMKLINTPDVQETFGAASRSRVLQKFSFIAFKKNLADILKRLVEKNDRKKLE